MSTVTDQRTLDKLCIDTIRTLSMDAVQKADSGHPGTPMALAPLAYVLYTRLMRHDPADAEWPDRDRFVLSCGHASMLLYSSLYLAGYGLELEDLERFRQLGSPTAGHPEHGDAAGIEVTTGPLGQGISNAVGFALAERMLAARYNRPEHEIVDHHTWAFCSDGDLEEGISHESCSLAGHLGLGRLVVFYDDNHISIEGNTALAFSDNVGGRFEAYGWHVQNLHEDIELDRLEQAAHAAQAETERPSLIICRTHIAPGAPNKQDTADAHGSPLGDAEIRLTKEAYGWPTEPPFYVPEEALAYFRTTCAERGRSARSEWQARLAAYRDAHPELAVELERQIAGRLPDGWDAALPKFEPDDGPVATRKSAQTVQHWAAERVPELIGGSADLAPSTLTLIKDAGDVGPHSYGGRNLHFGIREHGMGAVVNGLNLHYFRAYGATFLIFSDYMKGALRLSSVMGLPSIWVFTHDSIGLGEDGTTHQPIEQLATLRATPNCNLVRPADANETALAWRFAIRATSTPTALALTRQSLPILESASVPDDAIERGAYVLRDSTDEPDVVLLASGSEVSLAISAADLLEPDGIAARVVSMPCMDTFARQDAAYRDAVLPPAVRARVSVEAASPFGWDRWVGDAGVAIGMETFGASGPAGDLFPHFGFTPERVAETAREVRGRVA
jgi:transketolase